MQFNFMPIIGLDELSLLLKRTPDSIKRDRSVPSRRHTLPPAHKPSSTKNPLWITEEVVLWLKNQPEDPPATAQQKKAGRPTKREQINKRLQDQGNQYEQ